MVLWHTRTSPLYPRLMLGADLANISELLGAWGGGYAGVCKVRTAERECVKKCDLDTPFAEYLEIRMMSNIVAGSEYAYYSFIQINECHFLVHQPIFNHPVRQDRVFAR